MFRLIGIGLNPRQLTLEALHAIQASDKVYVENYTSKFAEGDIQKLETIIQKPIHMLQRKDVEDYSESFLSESKTHSISLLIFGNPLTATTHISLLEYCKQEKISYEVIPGISIFNYRGICGLDEYRFGRTTTFVFPREGDEPLSPFDVIVKNKSMGLHTHCLFDLHPDAQRFMSVDEAIGFIRRAAQAREISTHDWIGVGLGGMGNSKQLVRAGKLDFLEKQIWNIFPQSLIICGTLQEYEHEALQKLGGMK